jgi:hypothetical protein
MTECHESCSFPKDMKCYRIDANTCLIQKKTTALEKLKAIPIGKRIKISTCDSIEVEYVIWRTGEDEFKVEVKRYIDTASLLEQIWKVKETQEGRGEEHKPMSEEFEPACYYYETKEGWTAKQVLKLESFLTDVDNFKLIHDIECHELYEVPTESRGFEFWELARASESCEDKEEE